LFGSSLQRETATSRSGWAEQKWQRVSGIRAMVAGERVDVVGMAGRVATGGCLTEPVQCVAHGRRCSVVES